MITHVLFTFALAHAAKDTPLRPLATHMCAALLTQPGTERVHLEGEALFAINDTFAKLTAKGREETPWLDRLDRGVELIDRSEVVRMQVRDRSLMEPSAHPEKDYGTGYLKRVAVRMHDLYDDVTNLKPEAIAFGHVARGADAIGGSVHHIFDYLRNARESQTPAIAKGAPYLDPWTIARHIWNVPMAFYVFPSGLWLMGKGVYDGVYGLDFSSGALMAAVSAGWLAVNGPEFARYAAGFVSERLRTRYLNRYDQHRTIWSMIFPIDAATAAQTSSGDLPVFGYAWEGATISVKTLDALLALKANGELPVEAVLETLRHGQLPFKDIPETDRRYVFIDMIYYDGRAGEPPMLMTFLRFKKPEDLVGRKKPKKEKAPAPAEDWLPGAVPRGS